MMIADPAALIVPVPPPIEIKAARERAGLTLPQAAALAGSPNGRAWLHYESGTRQMGVDRWALFLLALGQHPAYLLRRYGGGTIAAAAMFAEDVDRTGLLTMQDAAKRSGLSRKTVLKHLRSGLLNGRLGKVFGKPIWLFKPAEVERYALIAKQEVAKATAEGKRRSGAARRKNKT